MGIGFQSLNHSLVVFFFVNTDLFCHEEMQLSEVVFGLKQTMFCKLKKPPVCSYSRVGWRAVTVITD